MTAPWRSAPQAGRGMKPFVGNLVLVAVGGYHEKINDGFRESPAVRIALVVLDGEERGLEIPDMVVSATRLVQRLRGMVGGVALGRVFGSPLPGDKTMYDLADPTANDEALARSWYDAFPGRLTELTRAVVATFAAEEAKLRPLASPSPSWTPPSTQTPPASPSQAWGTPPPNGNGGPPNTWTAQPSTGHAWSSPPSTPVATDALSPPY